MKIFLFSRGWPSEREPQRGSFEHDQAMALTQLGHQVIVLNVDARFRKYHRKYGVTEMHSEGIAIYSLFAGSVWGKALRMISPGLHVKMKRGLFLYLYNKVVKREGSPDVIYAHYLGQCSGAIAIKKKYGIPVVGIEHWSELAYESIKNNVKYIARKTYKELDLLLTVSSSLRENIKKVFGVDSVVVNNMVGQEFLEGFSITRNEVKSEKFNFIAVGNLLPVKGYDILIKAFAKSELAKKECALTIVGEGKERQHLEELIRETGQEDSITLPGRKPRREIIKVLNESDAFVLSSRSETFGVACIEALSQGLPAIATRCGGTEDIINDKNGILIDSDNVDALAEALCKMYEHCEKYDSGKIAEDCRNRFAPEVIAKQLEKLLGSVVLNS